MAVKNTCVITRCKTKSDVASRLSTGRMLATPPAMREAHKRMAYVLLMFFYHELRGSATPVLTVTGLVNGSWQFSTFPQRIHTP